MICHHYFGIESGIEIEFLYPSWFDVKAVTASLTVI